MLKPFIKSTAALFILAWLLPNVNYTDWLALIFFAFVLTIVNSVVKPVLKILTLPINIVTLGIFSVILDAGLLWLVLYLVPGFSINPMILFGVPLGEFLTLVVISAALALTQSLVSIFL